MTNPQVGHSSLQTPPSGRAVSVGWHLVPDEPPGTLAWWDGNGFAAIAFWASDHWEYVTNDWSGPDPVPGGLPVGAGDPRESGWQQTPNGRWHGREHAHPALPPRPTSSGGGPRASDKRAVGRDFSGCLMAGVIAAGVLVVAFMLLMGSFLRACENGLSDLSSFPTTPVVGEDCAATQRGVAPPPVGADLVDCNLVGADLAGAQLVSARLKFANLTNANLSGANLKDADLFLANLTGADLTGANLNGATWQYTICPDGTNTENDGHAKTCIGYGI
jgi:hypothetical protein